MLCASPSFASAAMSMASSSSPPVSRFAGLAHRTTTTLRYDQRPLPCSFTTGIQKKMRYPITTASADSPRPKSYKEVLLCKNKVTKPFRQMFAREISTHSKDSDISIAKVLLYIAAEDEAFLAFNREIDALYFTRERGNIQDQSDPSETDSDEQQLLLQLDGKSIPEWLRELDAISKQVEEELVSRGIINSSCHSLQVLEAVNTVLFDMRGFERIPTCLNEDPNHFYLHSVLNSRCSSAFLFNVIYIEVCQRLGVPIVGARVGEDFLVWPKTENPEELFQVTTTTSGKSLFATVNGECVDDPKSMASELTGESLLDFAVATNRDIISIALSNLIRVHWRRASKPTPGQMLTAPLSELNNFRISNFPLLRPQDLRLAIAAAERLLILEPNNWIVRRELGMMYYYVRQCRDAIFELSICIANFAIGEEEAKELEIFVEKLHRIFSLMSPLDSDRLAVH
ncbi:uncharacterized protein LOC108818682 isoform X2 [Raphanus sativus]|uniref:Uncharacterized protein LOC108818682 isoform X2 n=1 Tax=Raphanus sativus TaxID=3726 RepID=A0A6J0KGS5_RAPSA|nr:uncharacterized protein LOC108818682 isoform X2 [Raphanus sativus]